MQGLRQSTVIATCGKLASGLCTGPQCQTYQLTVEGETHPEERQRTVFAHIGQGMISPSGAVRGTLLG
jgi:hypothetical protein